MKYDLIIVGGGAAGFFMALNVAENRPDLQIAILERGKEVLSKVRISGGGRCNVTHAEFSPKDLTSNYPRGKKELLGPFHSFMTGDTIAWFEKRDIALKTEEDGRMFPITDSSETIIDCFLNEAKRHNINVLKSHMVKNVSAKDSIWIVETNKGTFNTERLSITTGSSPKMWNILKRLGHTIVNPVPSLFTFNINDKRIADLPGVTAEAEIKVLTTKLQSEGPVLITHWGLSGPAILKLSAWGALELAALNYNFDIAVNWLAGYTQEEVYLELLDCKENFAKQSPYTYAQFDMAKRLWHNLLAASGIQNDLKWADVKNIQLQQLAAQLTQSNFSVKGKSTFKEEFVTAGGVDLREIDFKTFESKMHPNLFLAGEVLNIDAITGGFNFQNAWTGGYIAAQAISNT
ncbi:NAD(P)/FAD-dependent oxidoreductase [Aquimarina brevivitae]|uniref:Flavoprotein n=1 Tax=Aquimarina brevivitae TaxID=323412 RepID=A0A4Q7PGU2_9FLAO|nr:NAD(P)/FAD-dependent oxidoreductase [Aquimarina brevivitae]RZS99751.1 hypothetical protein EV197_0977 [Aquimarina brevivitae]